MSGDIRVDVGFFHHRKTKRLIATLGLQGPWHLQILWSKMESLRPKGILTDMDEADIAMEADWPGEATEFVHALLTCGGTDKPGYLERLADGTYALHDWEQHQHFVYTKQERSELGKLKADKRWKKERDRLLSEGNAGGTKNDADGIQTVQKSDAASIADANGIEKACSQHADATDFACSFPSSFSSPLPFSSSFSPRETPPEKATAKDGTDVPPEKRNDKGVSKERAVVEVRELKKARASPQVVADLMQRYHLTELDLVEDAS